MSPKNHRISLKACLTSVFYLIVPLSALLFILHSYPELSTDLLYTRIYWVIPTAILVISLAQLSSMYPKGDTKRFLLNIGFTIATMVWMVGLLGGGVIITTQWNEYSFSLHMHRYVILLFSVAMVNILYFTLEWKVHRGSTLVPLSAEKETGHKQRGKPAVFLLRVK
ncbi:MAG: hypothetical protein JXA00_02840 [Candidatus Thermoplasmatota archaeon]|nr:hypothetical protein [Candidatus Thermoplasmatota archaeon]